MKKPIISWSTALLLFLLILPAASLPVRAAQTRAEFGSAGYHVTAGDGFRVGVHISADSDGPVGAYRLLIRYDAAVLEYRSGADEIADGCLVLTGETEENRLQRMLEFTLLSDDSSYLDILPGDAGTEEETEPLMSVPVFAQGEDDKLRLSGLTAQPSPAETSDAERQVYHMTYDPADGQPVIDAQADEGIQVQVPDLHALRSGRNIVRISLLDEEGNTGRCYILVEKTEGEVRLPVFTYEEAEWQILDSVQYAEQYLQLPYETATFSLDGMSVEFLCNAEREVYLVYAASPEGEISLFVYNLDDNTFSRCEELTSDRQSYYRIPPGSLVSFPSGYSPALLESQGVFAGLDREGRIGFYQTGQDGELLVYRLGNQEKNAGQEEERAPERGNAVLSVLTFVLAAAAAGLFVLFRMRSDTYFLAGTAAAGGIACILLVVQVVISFRPSEQKVSGEEVHELLNDAGPVVVSMLEEPAVESAGVELKTEPVLPGDGSDTAAEVDAETDRTPADRASADRQNGNDGQNRPASEPAGNAAGGGQAPLAPAWDGTMPPQGGGSPGGGTGGQPQPSGGTPQGTGDGNHGVIPENPGGNLGNEENPGGSTENPGGTGGSTENLGGSTENPGGTGGSTENPGGSGGNTENPGGTGGGTENPGGSGGNTENPGGSGGNPGDPGGNTENPGGSGGTPENPGSPEGNTENPGGTGGNTENPGGTPENPGSPEGNAEMRNGVLFGI